MQPVQDLTVEDRVSRTQFQYTLERSEPAELNDWVPRLLEKLQELPRSARRRQRPAEAAGSGCSWMIDRDTASRLGITPQTIDDTLVRRVRPAAGLHHLHAVESVSRGAGGAAGVAARADALRTSASRRRWSDDLYVEPDRAGRGDASELDAIGHAGDVAFGRRSRRPRRSRPRRPRRWPLDRRRSAPSPAYVRSTCR